MRRRPPSSRRAAPTTCHSFDWACGLSELAVCVCADAGHPIGWCSSRAAAAGDGRSGDATRCVCSHTARPPLRMRVPHGPVFCACSDCGRSELFCCVCACAGTSQCSRLARAAAAGDDRSRNGVRCVCSHTACPPLRMRVPHGPVFYACSDCGRSELELATTTPETRRNPAVRPASPSLPHPRAYLRTCT